MKNLIKTAASKHRTAINASKMRAKEHEETQELFVKIDHNYVPKIHRVSPRSDSDYMEMESWVKMCHFKYVQMIPYFATKMADQTAAGNIWGSEYRRTQTYVYTVLARDRQLGYFNERLYMNLRQGFLDWIRRAPCDTPIQRTKFREMEDTLERYARQLFGKSDVTEEQICAELKIKGYGDIFHAMPVSRIVKAIPVQVPDMPHPALPK